MAPHSYLLKRVGVPNLIQLNVPTGSLKALQGYLAWPGIFSKPAANSKPISKSNAAAIFELTEMTKPAAAPKLLSKHEFL